MIGCHCAVCSSTDSRDKRLRSSVMIEQCDTPESPVRSRIVIDAGPDFRYQMLREHIDRLDAILLTHEHKDHIAGIDDVRAYNYFQHKAIQIYATERVGRIVRKDFDYAFSEQKYPGVPEIDLRTIDPSESFDAAGMHVIPVAGRHYTLPVTGYRIGPVAYLTDFNSISDKELEKLRGVDVLVINALRYEPHISHFTVSQATDICRRVGARRSFLTHMSHQIGLYSEICDKLPEGIGFAYDGLKVYIDDSKL